MPDSGSGSDRLLLPARREFLPVGDQARKSEG